MTIRKWVLPCTFMVCAMLTMLVAEEPATKPPTEDNLCPLCGAKIEGKRLNYRDVERATEMRQLITQHLAVKDELRKFQTRAQAMVEAAPSEDPPERIKRLSDDAVLRSKWDEYNEVKSKYDDLASQVGPQHPTAKQAKAKLDAIEADLAAAKKYRNAHAMQIEADQTKNQIDLLTKQEQELRQRLDQLQAEIDASASAAPSVK